MRRLIRGGTIVSMHPATGVLHEADLLIHGNTIEAIGTGLHAPGAECIDARGCLVLPGLINAHQHTWQTALRGLASEWTLPRYMQAMHAGLARCFTAQDIFISTLVGAWSQIDCGVTTLVDWCHNNPTPEHSDRAVDALVQSGIRAIFMHGSPKPPPAPGQPHFSTIPHPRGEIERLSARLPREGRVTLGMAMLGPHYSTLDVTAHDLRLAREFDLVASMHVGGPRPVTPHAWLPLAKHGLLDDHVNIVHGNDLTDAELDALVQHGVSFSVTPETEALQGHGYPIIHRLRARGAEPTLGVDLESAISPDMLTVARMALAFHRAASNEAVRVRTGDAPEKPGATCEDAIRWITTRAAGAMGHSSRIGALAPGMAADVIVVKGDVMDLQPFDNPFAAVLRASPRNIDTVLVAGEILKAGGKLRGPDLGELQQKLTASRRDILQRFERLSP
jgi:cytosine/adenosine deaminase-related metal-dependent hydrolase